MIGNHFVIGAAAARIFGIKMADNCDPFAVAGEEKGRLPSGIVAIDERQHRIAPGRGFAHKGQPQIDTGFLQNTKRLVHFFLDQGVVVYRRS